MAKKKCSSCWASLPRCLIYSILISFLFFRIISNSVSHATLGIPLLWIITKDQALAITDFHGYFVRPLIFDNIPEPRLLYNIITNEISTLQLIILLEEYGTCSGNIISLNVIRDGESSNSCIKVKELASDSGVGSLEINCIDAERRALLKFKDNLISYNNDTLSSWGYEEEKKDCCSWDGIGCDNITGHVIMLNLSHLQLSTRGSIPNSLGNMTLLTHLNLRYNYFMGLILETFANLEILTYLDLSGNKLNGSILVIFENMTSSLIYLALDSNKNMIALVYLELQFNKPNSILETIGDMISLEHLDIGFNKLEGEIPKSIWNICSLRTLSLPVNNLGGELPELSRSSSMCTNHSLETLYLLHNKIMGLFPYRSLFSFLRSLDLSSDQISGHLHPSIGKVPTFIGSLTHMQTLRLTNNKFIGEIPLSLKKCIELILKCVKNVRATRSGNANGNSTTIEHLYNSYTTSISSGRSYYTDQIQVIWKGILSDYGNTLRLVKSIDLSSYMLNGEIPTEIIEPIALISFNLSRNNLSGQLPQHIGYLKSLDSLNLSSNHFSRQIPPSLALIDRLSVLNLSNNNLSRKIPTGTQLQSFDANAYMGNIGLCESRLSKRCPREEEPVAPSESTAEIDYKDEFIRGGFYLSLGIGFVVGFLGLCGTLFFNKSWRFAYFKFLNHFTNL
ncbi:leucine-rich repeat receptor protein kinase EMS1 [Ziziphus jujuba]|uniref:Leucine-rich repeat receptor protein kinase EMS1 n=1 Tax=Ziziphus jujuba TaxID=326968 RepID=A0ABM3IPT1_ZIZJJ|nr:leucine-rich repeat receptor protein kinase EMS1 [Ziziphus jujuba]